MAAVENLLASAAQVDFQESVLVPVRKQALDGGIDQRVAVTLQRQSAGQVNPENLTHNSLRLADPHVENLRSFDMQEALLHVLAGLFAEFARQVVRRGLADECLAATRRAMQQKPFRLRVMKSLKQVAVEHRQLD